VTGLEDEELLDAVRRTLAQLVLPRLEASGAEEFVLSQVKSCLSLLDFVRRRLPERQAARGTADAALAGLFARRDSQSAWTSHDAWSTGWFLAMERDPASTLSSTDRTLAAELRTVLETRLAAEIATRST
jgi:hypothetical protein